MSDNANSRKTETGVQSFFNTLKSRLGLVQHVQYVQPNTPDPQRIQALLSEIEQEVRLETRQGVTEHTSKPLSTQPKRAEDIEMQQQWAQDELKVVNLAIERKYEELRSAPLDEREEALCIEAIHKLEMRRLNLMAKLHGQDINGYAAAR